MNTKKSQKQADQASAVEPMELMSVSEQMQEELEPILLDGNGVERYKSAEIKTAEELYLLRFDDPFLRRVPAPFRFEDMDEHGGLDPKEIKERLLKVMYRDGGVGLSANQVGINAACFVMGDKASGFEKIFINPKIIGVGEEQESIKEGCTTSTVIMMLLL